MFCNEKGLPVLLREGTYRRLLMVFTKSRIIQSKALWDTGIFGRRGYLRMWDMVSKQKGILQNSILNRPIYSLIRITCKIYLYVWG